MFNIQVKGREATHDVTISMDPTLEWAELKVESLDATRRFEINVCNTMEPKLGVSRYRSWMYDVLSDTKHPEWKGRLVNEKTVIVYGVLGYHKKDDGDWAEFLDREHSRRAFSDKLRETQRILVEAHQKDQREGVRSIKEINDLCRKVGKR